MIVVLPQREGPTMATNSDCRMSRLMSEQASTTPSLVWYCLPTLVRRMKGSVVASIVFPISNEAPLRGAPRRGVSQTAFLLLHVGRLGQVLVGVVLRHVWLRRHLGELLQEILAFRPVFLRRPEQWLPFGVLGVDDRHGAVDLEQ